MDTVSLSDSSKKVGRIPWDDGTIIQTPTRSRMQRSNSMQLPSPPSLDSLSKTGSSRNLNMMSPISSPSSKRIVSYPCFRIIRGLLLCSTIDRME